MARGGRRPGSGRKPKATHLRGIDGGASHSSRPASTPSAPPAVEPAAVSMPACVTDPAVVAIWDELAPLALEQRTLTPATVRTFALLCRLTVLEATLGAAEAGSAAHRGVLQRLSALQLQFLLAPCGKPLFEPAKPVEQPKTGLRKFLAV